MIYTNLIIFLALVPTLLAIADEKKLTDVTTFPKDMHGHFHKLFQTLVLSKAKRTSNTAQHSSSSQRGVSYLSAGYVYLQLSDQATDNTCRRTSMQFGIPVNQCVSADTSSYMIKLATDSCADASVFVYADTTCTTLRESFAMDTLEDTCTPYSGNTEVAYGRFTGSIPVYFWKLHCTAQPTKPLVADSAVVEFYSDQAGCANYVGFASFAPDMCIPISNGAFSVAVRCDTQGKVTLVQNFGGTCSLAFIRTPYEPTCTAASAASPLAVSSPSISASTSAAAADTNSAVSSVDVSESPAVTTEAAGVRQLRNNRPGRGGSSSTENPESPSGSTEEELELPFDPSLLMGMAPPVAAFKTQCGRRNVNYAGIMAATQTLSGVSIAAYQADTEAFTLVLQRAIAASIGSGVTFQDIYIAAVTAATRTGTGSGGGSRASTHATSSLRAQRHPGPDQAAAAAVNTLNTDAISVAYTVLSYISTVTNKDLSSLLQTAVDSGSFDTLLHQWASSQGVSALTGASSSAVSVNSFAADGGSGGGTEEGAGGGEEGTEDDGGENPITIIAGSAPTDSSSDSKTLPQILIIGIAAGGALLLIIVGTIYWCLAAKAPVSVATALPAGVELNSSASTATSAAAAAAADTAVPSAPMQMCSVFAAPAGDKSDAPVLAVAAPTAPAAVVRVTASDVQVYV